MAKARVNETTRVAVRPGAQDLGAPVPVLQVTTGTTCGTLTPCSIYKERQKLQELQQEAREKELRSELKAERSRELEELKAELTKSLGSARQGTVDDTIYQSLIRSPTRSSGRENTKHDESTGSGGGLTSSIWQVMKKFAGRRSSSSQTPKRSKKQASSESTSSSVSSAKDKKKKKKSSRTAKKVKKEKSINRSAKNVKKDKKRTKLPTKEPSTSEAESDSSGNSSEVKPLKITKLVVKERARGKGSSSASRTQRTSDKQAAGKKQFDANALALKTTYWTDEAEVLSLPSYGNEGIVDTFVAEIAEKAHVVSLNITLKQYGLNLGRSKVDKVRTLLMHNIASADAAE